jgi:hypothetical protein
MIMTLYPKAMVHGFVISSACIMEYTGFPALKSVKSLEKGGYFMTFPDLPLRNSQSLTTPENHTGSMLFCRMFSKGSLFMGQCGFLKLNPPTTQLISIG